MKKKERHKKKETRRNAVSAGAAARRVFKHGEAPSWRTTAASVAGGVGGAVLGGLLVATKTLDEPEAGILITAAGAGAAYFGDGYARIVANSAAAAGAGQLALHYMARRATNKKGRDEKEKADREKAEADKLARAVAAQVQPALPPGPSAGGLANAANGGGYLADLFRGAADELEMLDPDEERNAEVDVFHVEDFAA